MVSLIVYNIMTNFDTLFFNAIFAILLINLLILTVILWKTAYKYITNSVTISPIKSLTNESINTFKVARIVIILANPIQSIDLQYVYVSNNQMIIIPDYLHKIVKTLQLYQNYVGPIITVPNNIKTILDAHFFKTK